MNKQARQNKIIEIINSREIDTQEELVLALNEFNLNVTQATVSRDIKELNLIKVSGKVKRFKYACEKKVSDFNDLKLLNLFKNCVVKIDVAQNTLHFLSFLILFFCFFRVCFVSVVLCSL